MKRLVFLGAALMALAATPVPAQQIGSQNIQSFGVSSFVIPPGSRAALRNFIEKTRSQVCDNNDIRDVPVPCVPANMAVPTYAPGATLPMQENAVKVPSEVTATLPATPSYTQYVYAAHNVYLIENPSRRIVDVVTVPEGNR